jgi:Holliday junction DNA helicase RuvA
MIAFVRGEIATVGLTSAVVDVGGVGLEMHCTPATLAKLRTGTTATLQTSMVVREDSMSLFGFANDDEKQVFEMLQTASGVGPKLAQAMLAVYSPDALRAAIGGEDVKSLTAIPGIGQKGAQRIILELKDRIGPVIGSGHATVPQQAELPWRRQVAEGLVGLGWSAKEAEKACTAVAEQAATMDTPDVAVLLRAALQTLSRS